MLNDGCQTGTHMVLRTPLAPLKGAFTATLPLKGTIAGFGTCQFGDF